MKKRHQLIIMISLAVVFLSVCLPLNAMAAHGSPQWLKLDPRLKISEEGFRGVMWCTPSGDIPWKMRGTFIHPCRFREDEDFNIFGVTAKYITYTFRNSVFYGIRIDIEGACKRGKGNVASYEGIQAFEGYYKD